MKKNQTYFLRLMKLMLFSTILNTIVFFGFNKCVGQNVVIDNKGEGYFFHTGDYPDDATPVWGDNHWSPNGIAHDEQNWYIATIHRDDLGKTDNSNYKIWKIPVSQRLDQYNPDNPIIKKWELKTSGMGYPFIHYRHVGDLDCYKYDGVNYLIVPLTYSEDFGSGEPIIAFFNAATLSVVNFAYLHGQHDVSWCSISHKNDSLYTSNDSTSRLYKYYIDWDKVRSGNHEALTRHGFCDLLKTNSSNTLSLQNIQGGEFSPSGDFLYISSGIVECDFNWPFPDHHSHATYDDGIHVFETANWHEVIRSTNHDRGAGVHCFDFPFDNYDLYISDNDHDSNNDDCYGEEPEGLTIWELNNGQAYNVTGGLHVLMDDHNYPSSSKVNLKHFKSFKRPADIIVYATNPTGEQATNPQISAFLNQPPPFFGNCAAPVGHVNPTFFPAGKTPVRFDVSDGNKVAVRCTSYVNVINRHDECLTALTLNTCNGVITDNYCASLSANIPPITGYTGTIKDVWFKLDPPSNSNVTSFSIETYEVTGGLTKTVMQVLSGSCGHLHEIASNDGVTNGGHAKIIITGYSSTQPLYVRVTDFGGNNYGKFGIIYKKIANGSNIFTSQRLIYNEPDSVLQYPVLKGDVNGDGRMDLIFEGQDWGGNTNLSIRVKLGNTDGTFTSLPQQNLGDGSMVHAYPTLTGDVNGDGRTDLIFVGQDWGGNYNLCVRVKLGNSNGTFTALPQQNLGDGSMVNTYPVLTGDVNGDGKTDLIFEGQDWGGNYNLCVRVKLGNANGTFTALPQQNLDDGSMVNTFPVLTGDVNGDGKTDLIFEGQDWGGNTNLCARVKLGKTDGTFTALPQQNFGDGSGVHTYPVLTGDVNGDGRTDLIFEGQDWSGNTNLCIRVKLGNADGTFTALPQQSFGDGNGVHTYPVLLGDVNGDGKTDLIFIGQDWTGCGLNIRVKLSNGDGTWCKDWQVTGDNDNVFNYPGISGDINGDHKTDLLFTYHSGDSLIIKTKIANSSYTCNPLNSDVDFQQSIISNYLLYPNPTSNYFQVRTLDPQMVSIKLINSQGIVIKTYEQFNTEVDKIDMSLLQNGIYFVEIINKLTNERITRRIVKII